MSRTSYLKRKGIRHGSRCKAMTTHEKNNEFDKINYSLDLEECPGGVVTDMLDMFEVSNEFGLAGRAQMG